MEKEIKIKTIFFILLGIWAIDFILTIIGVKLFGFNENNPIMSTLIGSVGFFGIFIMASSTFLFMSFLFHKVSYNRYNKKPNMALFTGLSVFCLIEFYAIVNNFYWLVSTI
jgi:hypothetical protein